MNPGYDTVTPQEGNKPFDIMVRCYALGNWAERAIRVLVIGVSAAPTITPISTITVAEGSMAEVAIEAIDPEGDTVTLQLETPQLWATVDSETKKLKLQPGHDLVTRTEGERVFELSIAASDGTFIGRTTATIRITHVELPPVLAVIPEQ